MPQDSPTSTKQSTNKNTKTGECICPICLDPIVDAKSKQKGQDSIFCDSQCSAWLHRQCAGLSKSLFESWTESEKPFYCPHCRLHDHTYTLEIAKLKEAIESLTKSISGINEKSEMSTKPNTNQQTINKTTTVIASDEPKPSSEKQKENTSDKI